MSNTAEIDNLFGRSVTFPDTEARERLSLLVGLDEKKARLSKILTLLVHPKRLEDWARRHHPEAKKTLQRILRRPPLVVLAGDVGTGKTELAETIGDSVARDLDIGVTLLPLSLSTRGQGRVGEMTRLITAAFDCVEAEAKKLTGRGSTASGAVLLLIDEADALAQSRELAQMHHEDRAGVNALIRGIDKLGQGGLPAAVILCTNRPGAIDPAVKRRAAEILTFSRPDEVLRRAVLGEPLEDLGLNSDQITAVVTSTGHREGQSFGFTYSDLRQRLLPALDAFPHRAVDPARAVEIAREMEPTPPFQEGSL